MDLARLNFSHGSHQAHRQMFHNIKDAQKQAGGHVGIIGDLQGPKIRTGALEGGGPVQLQKGQTIEIVSNPDKQGNAERIYTTYESLADDVSPGDRVLLDDGHLELTVESTGEKTVEIGRAHV